MGGMVGYLGRKELDLELAAKLMAHRGANLHVVEEENFSVAVRSDDDDCLYSNGRAAAAICGSGHFKSGEKLSARRLVSEYLSSGTIDASEILGHFSFVIADLNSKDLILCRDSVAVTPLHVMKKGGAIHFATEYKTLLDVPSFDYQIDTSSLTHFISTGWNSSGTTFFKDIKPLVPGNLVIHRQNNSVLMTPIRDPYQVNQSGNVSSSDLLAALQESIETFLSVSGQNIGIMLSGGIDSALIGALLKQQTGDRKIQSFTVGYGDTDPEISGAKATAETLGFDHHEVILDQEQFEELISPAIWAMENICGFDEYPCLFGLLQTARSTVDTLFSGNFSDTIFAGMETHRIIWEKCYSDNKKISDLDIAMCSNTCEEAQDSELVSDVITYPVLSRNLTQELLGALSTRDERMSAQEMFAANAGARFLLPYTHPAVIDVALQVTDAQKLSEFKNKIILRECAEKVLPRSISERKKHIQQMPYDKNMQAFLLKTLRNIVSDRESKVLDFIQSDYISHFYRKLSADLNSNNIQKAWNIVAFEYWCRSFLK